MAEPFAELDNGGLNEWLEARGLPRIEDEEMDGAALLGLERAELKVELKWSLPKFGKLWTLLEAEKQRGAILFPFLFANPCLVPCVC